MPHWVVVIIIIMVVAILLSILSFVGNKDTGYWGAAASVLITGVIMGGATLICIAIAITKLFL